MASLTYPEDGLGKKFWDRVYQQAYDIYGTTEIPLNTFNKVWIVPSSAVVYEKKNTVFVVESKLKVMMEEDYLALKNNLRDEVKGTSQLAEGEVEEVSRISSEIAKEILLSEIEKEVNVGQNFALLRQIYNSLILATWYKKNLKESILNKIYSDQKKVTGVDVEDKEIREKIYAQYVEAFKRGVFDMIKEEYDEHSQKVIPRKYFSGGMHFDMAMLSTVSELPAGIDVPVDGVNRVALQLDVIPTQDGSTYSGESSDKFMLGSEEPSAQDSFEGFKSNDLGLKVASTAGGVGLFPNKPISKKGTAAFVVNQIQSKLAAQARDQDQEIIDEEKKIARQQGLEHTLRFLEKRFGLLDDQDPFYRETMEVFEKVIGVLKSRGEVAPDREYHLALFNSNEVQAWYQLGTDHVFLSKGILVELDKYLKNKTQGKAGIGLDHIAGILGHELQHSTHRFRHRLDASAEQEVKTGEGRRKEYDADIEAISLSDAAGSNPEAYIEVMDFFISINQLGWMDMMWRMEDEHPMSQERRDLLSKIIQDKNEVFLNVGKSYQMMDSFFHYKGVVNKKDFLGRVGNIDLFWQHLKDKGYISEFEEGKAYVTSEFTVLKGPDDIDLGDEDEAEEMEIFDKEKTIHAVLQHAFEDTCKRIGMAHTYDYIWWELPENLTIAERILNAGEVHEVMAILFAIMDGNMSSLELGVRKSWLSSIMDEETLKPLLLEYIQTKYSEDFSDLQQELLYQLHFGFLFSYLSTRVKHKDSLLVDSHKTILSELIDQMNPEEVEKVYTSIISDPPVYIGDLPMEVRKKGNKSIVRATRLYLEHFSYANSLMAQKLSLRTVLEGLRDHKNHLLYFYYQQGISQLNDKEFYWEELCAFIGNQIHDQESLNSVIQQIKDVFQGEYAIRDATYGDFLEFLITKNEVYNQLSYEEQIQVINELLPRKSKIKDGIIGIFLDPRPDGSRVPSYDQKINGLRALLKLIDLSEDIFTEAPFFDNTGLKHMFGEYDGDVKAKKSTYGKLVKQLTDALSVQDQSEGEIGAVQKIINLIDQDILLDYQDLMQQYQDSLERALPSDYLKIAEAIERFIERNGFSVEGEEKINHNQKRIFDYHNAFILAYFYKTQGVPFAFFKDVNTYNYNFTKVPVILSNTTQGSSGYLSIRPRDQVFLPGSGIGRFFNVLSDVLAGRSFRTSIQHLRILKDRLISEDARSDWINMFYEFADLKGGEVLEIISYLEGKTEIETSVIGQGANNPLSLVSTFHKLNIVSHGQSVSLNKGIGEKLNWSLGFELLGTKAYTVTSPDQLMEEVDELERYFPEESPLRNNKLEKILIAFLSHITGVPFTKRTVEFELYRQGLSGPSETMSIEGYELDSGIYNQSLTEDQARDVLEGFVYMHERFSIGQQVLYGKLIYKLFKNNPKLSVFDDFTQHMDFINTIFRSYSKAKDDFVYQAIEEHDITVAQYRDAIGATTRYVYKDDTGEVDKTIYQIEIIKLVMDEMPVSERRQLLLWLITGDEQYKPDAIVKFERDNNTHANELVEIFRGLTASEREYCLNMILTGKNGLFVLDYPDNEKIDEYLFPHGRSNYRSFAELEIELTENIGDWYDFEKRMGKLRSEYLAELFANVILKKTWDEKSFNESAIIEGSSEKCAGMDHVDWQVLKAVIKEVRKSNNINEIHNVIENQLIPLLDNNLGLLTGGRWSFVTKSEKTGNLLSPFLEKFRKALRTSEGSQNFLAMGRDDRIEQILEEIISSYSSNPIRQLGTMTTFKEMLEQHRQDRSAMPANEAQFIDQIMPILRQLAELWADSLDPMIHAFEGFFDNHVNTRELELVYQQEQARTEDQLRLGLIAARESGNPSFRLLGELVIQPQFYHYWSDLLHERMEQAVAFEGFLDELMETQVKSIFGNQQYEVLKGLIDIKFNVSST